MSEKHNPDNDINEEDAAPFEEETPADAVILSPQGEGSPAGSSRAEEETPADAVNLSERSESKDLTSPSVILSEAKDPTPQAESLPEEGETPAAGGAPSDEGAVEDGTPSETEGGIPAPAADPVILSERSASKDLTSPSVILSEAKDPTHQADALPEEGETPAAGGAPSDEGAVEDGTPSETEGGIPDPAPADPDPAPKEKKSIIRRIIGIVGYTVVVALMLLVAFILFSNMSGKVTFIFGRTAMWVKTESMAPQIPERSYILVRKAPASEVKEGDVIVFKSDDPSIAGSYNTHRVIEIIGVGAEFVTKGDNNAIADQYTAKAANVLGIYEKNLPLMTSFGRVLSTSQGIMITFTMIFVIFLIIYVPDMTRASKRRSDEADRIEKARVEALVALEVERLKAEAAAKAAAEAAASSSAREDRPPDGEIGGDGDGETVTPPDGETADEAPRDAE